MTNKNDELIEIILSSNTFNDNEKKHYAGLISSGSITDKEEDELLSRIFKELEEDKKKINKIDNEIIRNQEILEKYTKLESDIIDKVTNIYEKEADLNIKKVESFIEKTYINDYEDFKKEEKELDELYRKFLENEGKKKIKNINKIIK